jgi:hypothetical protein
MFIAYKLFRKDKHFLLQSQKCRNNFFNPYNSSKTLKKVKYFSIFVNFIQMQGFVHMAVNN